MSSILVVTADVWELPVAIYDTLTDCARELGVGKSSISMAVKLGCESKLFDKRKVRFLRINMEEL